MVPALLVVVPLASVAAEHEELGLSMFASSISVSAIDIPSSSSKASDNIAKVSENTFIGWARAYVGRLGERGETEDVENSISAQSR